MAPKQRNAAARSVSPVPPSTASPGAAAAPTATASSSSSSSTPAPATTTAPAARHATSKLSSSSSAGGAQAWDRIVGNVVAHYLDTTPQRTKLLDAFMAFLVAVGALQFAYCVLAGNYPFNAFLSGFAATVGQFVLTGRLEFSHPPRPVGDA
ncbi:uncharacterized protein THITE_2113728 [Thermothielavioides terrestris NRRL 8126]|uniref:Dolichyl-diphosphooligosaccharide--protein glycosyltransferase subunit OST2 n=1 Tax=Thermothielavioides terrestris (strain ATCC 38088 / NRRL 8126) TaxID=578455 RepID=G2R3V8_THETT|nr:uncharacterized protein THITE_2113728 [Thermothielavioides terrestris NRRL 8126]AEO66013.1 hypothetical protein THITE_2113728 [Thermothielavioides terrestris NRRL 8126]